MLTGRPWQRPGVADGRVAIDTPQGRASADFIIAGTGIEVDHRLRPELAHFADDIATWNDRFKPPPGEENTRLGLYPYLSPSFAFVERVPGAVLDYYHTVGHNLRSEVDCHRRWLTPYAYYALGVCGMRDRANAASILC
jgi:hypothetical protein